MNFDEIALQIQNLMKKAKYLNKHLDKGSIKDMQSCSIWRNMRALTVAAAANAIYGNDSIDARVFAPLLLHEYRHNSIVVDFRSQAN